MRGPNCLKRSALDLHRKIKQNSYTQQSAISSHKVEAMKQFSLARSQKLLRAGKTEKHALTLKCRGRCTTKLRHALDLELN